MKEGGHQGYEAEQKKKSVEVERLMLMVDEMNSNLQGDDGMKLIYKLVSNLCTSQAAIADTPTLHPNSA